MVVVTGCKRSGTSMWMGILRAAGFEVLGEQFPMDWQERLGVLNPDGFFESRFRASGISVHNNPDPVSGEYVHPNECASHAIKIFATALPMTELSYLRHVVGTMRHWRGYRDSRARLQALDAGVDEQRQFSAGYNMPAHLDWWVCNYVMLRDAFLREYPFTLFSYESILGSGGPALIAQTMQWIGSGDSAAATSVVRFSDLTARTGPDHRDDVGPNDYVDEATAAVFDELWRRVHIGAALDTDFIDTMNTTHARLLPQIVSHHEASTEAARATLRQAIKADVRKEGAAD